MATEAKVSDAKGAKSLQDLCLEKAAEVFVDAPNAFELFSMLPQMPQEKLFNLLLAQKQSLQKKTAEDAEFRKLIPLIDYEAMMEIDPNRRAPWAKEDDHIRDSPSSDWESLDTLEEYMRDCWSEVDDHPELEMKEGDLCASRLYENEDQASARFSLCILPYRTDRYPFWPADHICDDPSHAESKHLYSLVTQHMLFCRLIRLHDSLTLVWQTNGNHKSVFLLHKTHGMLEFDPYPSGDMDVHLRFRGSRAAVKDAELLLNYVLSPINDPDGERLFARRYITSIGDD